MAVGNVRVSDSSLQRIARPAGCLFEPLAGFAGSSAARSAPSSCRTSAGLAFPVRLRRRRTPASCRCSGCSFPSNFRRANCGRRHGAWLPKLLTNRPRRLQNYLGLEVPTAARLAVTATEQKSTRVDPGSRCQSHLSGDRDGSTASTVVCGDHLMASTRSVIEEPELRLAGPAQHRSPRPRRRSAGNAGPDAGQVDFRFARGCPRVCQAHLPSAGKSVRRLNNRQVSRRRVARRAAATQTVAH